MKTYYFKAEGVNLGPAIYDTSDISAIRGGGFYLLDRLNRLADSKDYEDHKISEGASSAIFRYTTNDPEEFRERIFRDLHGKIGKVDPILEMTFLVEYTEVTDDFSADMAELTGKIRVAQMQSPTIRLFENTLAPGTGKDEKPMGFDSLNRVLPAHVSGTGKGDISTFTDNRRKQGRNLRGEIYTRVLKEKFPEISGCKFTEDLQSLCEDQDRGNLNGKMAFIYIDGNKFGALQKKFTQPKDLKKFDRILQDFKTKFLGEVVGLALNDPTVLSGKSPLRMETLLWGGDEIKIVVPAWMGWKTAACFFDAAKDLKISVIEKDKETETVYDLTYAMGLVFTQHKNPIRNVNEIAENLAEAVKDNLAPEKEGVYNREKGNRMHYMVLESMETLPMPYEYFAPSFYKTPAEAVVLSPEEMDRFEELAKKLKAANFSRGRVHSLASAMAEGDTDKYKKECNKGMDSLEIEGVQKEKIRKKIDALLPEVPENIEKSVQRPLWIQLAELWDYLTAKSSVSKGKGGMA